MSKCSSMHFSFEFLSFSLPDSIPVLSFSQHASHGSGISNLLESPRQSRLYIFNSHNGCSQLHTIVSLGFHGGTSLTHSLPHSLSFDTGKFHPWLKIQYNLIKADKSSFFLEYNPLVQIYLYQLYVFNGFLHCQSFFILELSLQTILALNSKICVPLFPKCWD